MVHEVSRKCYENKFPTLRINTLSTWVYIPKWQFESFQMQWYYNIAWGHTRNCQAKALINYALRQIFSIGRPSIFSQSVVYDMIYIRSTRCGGGGGSVIVEQESNILHVFNLDFVVSAATLVSWFSSLSGITCV